MKYYKIPINLIPKGSRVILYGGGKIGKSIYIQNKELMYFDIIAIIDQNADAMIDDRSCLLPDELKHIDFDYVIICVTENNFGIIYETIMKVIPTISKSKIVYVEMEEKECCNPDDVPVLDDTIHWLMENEAYRDKRISDYDLMITRKSPVKNCNCIDEDTSIPELLQLCFKLKYFIFHVVGKDGAYKGSVIHENICKLGESLSAAKCAGDLITLLKKENVCINYSAVLSEKYIRYIADL